MMQAPAYAEMSKADLIGIIETQQKIIQRFYCIIPVSNKTFSPSEKLTWLASQPLVTKEKPNAKGLVRLPIGDAAEQIGMSDDTVGRSVKNMCERTGATHEVEPYTTKSGQKCHLVWVDPTDPLWTNPDAIQVSPELLRNLPGDDRRCPCGGKLRIKKRTIVEQEHHVCESCGTHTIYPAHLVNEVLEPNYEPTLEGPQLADLAEETAQDENEGVQLAELAEEEKGLKSAATYDPVTQPIGAQVSPAVEVDQSTKFVDLLEEWLSKRLGEGQTIWSTGDVEQVNQEKYYSHRVGTKLDIKGYIEGKPRCIYGSPLRLKDGKTWVLSFDIDKTEQTLLKFDYLRMLARAGIYAIYWQRRAGRGHLEIYFSEEVDIKAAYGWVISVCPQMGDIEECYPYNGKFNGRVSWPLYHRMKTFDENKQEISDQVIECAMIAMLPSADKPIHCAGIKSDPEGLRAIVAQAVTPAALIPERIVTQASNEATTPVGELLDTRLPQSFAGNSDGLGKAVIAEFNDAHTWEEIAALCGGLQRDRFCSPAHKEDTPSVVIKGNYASDFGRTPSGRVETRDKFGWWCLAKGINQDEEIKRRIAERQEALA